MQSSKSHRFKLRKKKKSVLGPTAFPLIPTFSTRYGTSLLPLDFRKSELYLGLNAMERPEAGHVDLLSGKPLHQVKYFGMLLGRSIRQVQFIRSSVNERGGSFSLPKGRDKIP